MRTTGATAFIRLRGTARHDGLLLAVAVAWVAVTVSQAGEARAREAVRSFAPAKVVNYREPVREYITTNAAGWKVQLEQALADSQPELAQTAVARLDDRLKNLLSRLPAVSHERLRELPIFLLYGEEAKAGGRDNGAEYFQRHAPEHFPLTDPRWGSSLVIYSARNYTLLSDEWALRVLVHELAHAWQLEQWPEDQADLVVAFRNATDRGLYRGVKDVNGDVIARAYAAQNALEYFAELSCAYFLRGEYEPFDRAALRSYDPVGFAVVERLWGISGPPPPRERHQP